MNDYEEITVPDMIESLRTQNAGEVSDALAEKALKMFYEHQGRCDFESNIIDNLHRENDTLKTQNDKLINVLYLVSEKI